MKRVVVVFFKGVFLTSPFLIWIVFLSCTRLSSSFLPLVMFQCIYTLTCAIISGISPTFFFFFSPLHVTVRPNNAFSSGTSLISFLTDTAIFLLLIYSFSLRRSWPFRNTAWFSSSALKLCAHTSAILHTHAVSLYLKQSVLVQVVDLLFPACWGAITFASAHGTGARRHVWGGDDSVKTTQSRTLSK